jgi:arginine deiminase
MYKNLKKCKINDKEVINEESNEELLAAREEIEFLRQLIETQNSHIYNLENELLEANQELEVVNDELAKTLMAGVSFDEAKAIAKTMLNSQECTSELVEKLLNIIYGLLEEPQKLKEKVKFNIEMSQVNNQLASKVITQSQELRNNSKEMRSQHQELGYRFITLKANLNKIQEYLNNSNNSSV